MLFRSPESSHPLGKQHEEHIRNGLKLPVGPKMDRFKEIQKRPSQLKIDFRKNENEDNDGIWFHPEELDGIPEDVVSRLEKGTRENEAKLTDFRVSALYPRNTVCQEQRDSEACYNWLSEQVHPQRTHIQGDNGAP